MQTGTSPIETTSNVQKTKTSKNVNAGFLFPRHEKVKRDQKIAKEKQDGEMWFPYQPIQPFFSAISQHPFLYHTRTILRPVVVHLFLFRCLGPYLGLYLGLCLGLCLRLL